MPSHPLTRELSQRASLNHLHISKYKKYSRSITLRVFFIKYFKIFDIQTVDRAFEKIYPHRALKICVFQSP